MPSHHPIHDDVKARYGALVTDKKSLSCCGPSSCCTPQKPMEGKLVASAGYATNDLASLPDHAVSHAYGCGNPLAFSEVKSGETVLDIGSGAGIDCFIAARKVGENGRVIGIDMTPEMLDKARQNAQAGGYDNVEFLQGQAEALPVDDTSVDWVISNCVINLSPDKPRVFAEIARILKPGGRFAISDIVLGDDLPQTIAESVSAWTGCVAGAIRETDYVRGLEVAGLSDVTVDSRIQYDADTIRDFIGGCGIDGMSDGEQAIRQVTGKIWSAKITGQKPSGTDRSH